MQVEDVVFVLQVEVEMRSLRWNHLFPGVSTDLRPVLKLRRSGAHRSLGFSPEPCPGVSGG